MLTWNTVIQPPNDSVTTMRIGGNGGAKSCEHETPAQNVRPQLPPVLTIGYAYVVADLIHVGHVNFLETCKSLCDKLVVGVLTDAATHERKELPTIPFQQRLRMVSALRCVDAVVAQSSYSPLRVANLLRPNILFESSSHLAADIGAAQSTAAQYGGRVIVLPYYEGCSSTAIKNAIKGES